MSNEISELFWNASVDEMKRGYVYHQGDDAFVCLADGQRFTKGVIYPHEGVLYEAEKYVQLHLRLHYGSMLEFLMGLDKKLTGLTELQKSLLERFHRGLPDGEIVKELEAGSASTIRNHRFALRERMKQAKVFLSIMELVEEKTDYSSRFVTIHRTATMIDERYAITEQENADILKTYFKEDPDGPLSEFPKKEKRKVAILRHLALAFEPGRRYTEKEVNDRIKPRFADYVTIRRYFIEYGFMDRLPDGSAYWLKQ